MTKLEKINAIIAYSVSSGLMDSLIDQLANSIKANDSEFGKLFTPELVGMLKEELDHQVVNLYEPLTKFYDTHYNEAEITELLAQLESPLGQKVVSLMPLQMEALMKVNMQMSQAFQAKFMKLVQAQIDKDERGF